MIKFLHYLTSFICGFAFRFILKSEFFILETEKLVKDDRLFKIKYLYSLKRYKNSSKLDKLDRKHNLI